MDQKEILRQGMYGVVYSIIIIVIIRYFGLKSYGLVLFFVSLSAAHYAYKIYRKKATYSTVTLFKNLAGTALTLTLIMIAAKWFGAYGFLGVAVFIVLLALWRVYKQRGLYMEGMRHIESMIWGKSLDKDKWADGEFKDTKVKVVWRKDGHSDHNN